MSDDGAHYEPATDFPLPEEIEGVDSLSEESFDLISIYATYGRTMEVLQFFELNIWVVLAARFKKGIQFDQAMGKVQAWNRETLERLLNTVELPADLKAETERVLEIRNRLAHRFLRDHSFGIGRDAEYRQNVISELKENLEYVATVDQKFAQYCADQGWVLDDGLSPEEVEAAMEEAWNEMQEGKASD